MLSLYDLYNLVIKNMVEKKKRVFLTISGIIIGIFTFTFFIFVSQGLSNAITEQFSALGVNILAVTSAESGGGGPPSGGGLTDTHVSKIKQVVRGYEYIAPFIFYQGLYEYGREKSVVTTLAYPDEYWKYVVKDLSIELEQGRFLREGDKGVIILGHKTSTEAFGDKIVGLGSSIKIGDDSFRVVGIIKERGDLFVDSSMIMPFDNLKVLSGQDTYSGIRVSLFEGVDAATMKEAIETKLNPRNGEKVVSITSPTDAIEQFNQILGVLKMIISFVSVIALIVGGVNVMNTMYSNILERINEISVMKALGATNHDIRNLFLFESSLLGIVGALIGFTLSFVLAKLLAIAILELGYNVPIYFSLSFFFEVILITGFFTILCGTYPAIKAAMVDPADNLRDD